MSEFKVMPVQAGETGEYNTGDKPYAPTETVYTREPGAKFLAMKDADQLRWLASFLRNGTYIAGGAVADAFNGTGTSRDVDLFFRDRTALEEAVTELLSHGFEADPDAMKHIDDSTYALKEGADLKEVPFLQFVSPRPEDKPVQCICFVFYESAERCIDDFDFTCTQFALDCSNDTLVYNPVSVQDVLDRALVIHRLEPKGALEKRIRKYVAKGYVPRGNVIEETARVALARTEPANEQQVETQLDEAFKDLA